MKIEKKLIQDRIKQLEDCLDAHRKAQIKISVYITGINEELDALSNTLDMLVVNHGNVCKFKKYSSEIE